MGVYIKKRYSFYAALALLCLAPSWRALSQDSAPVQKPLSQILPYQEFEKLVKETVERIPDLQPLWKSKYSKDIYFGGGSLRGTLQWLNKKLQNNTPDEIRKMPIPTTKELLIIQDSDLDLFVADGIDEKIKKSFPYFKNWDLIDESNRLESVKLGGTTLEKLSINPKNIRDPLGGLKHYYQGQLVFHWSSETVFQNSKWFYEYGTTRTEEALRFLRMSIDLPELKATPESIENIKKIPTAEVDLLDVRNIIVQNRISGKALKKLYLANKKNLPATIEILRQNGLLEFLAVRGFGVPSDDSEKALLGYASDFIKKGYSIRELKMFESMQIKSVDNRFSLTKQILFQKVKTAQDFVDLMTPLTRFNTFEYEDLLKKLSLEYFDSFIRMNPNNEQMIQLFKAHLTLASDSRILKHIEKIKPALLELSKDEKMIHRAAAHIALGDYEEFAHKELRQILRSLNSNDIKIKKQAAENLEELLRLADMPYEKIKKDLFKVIENGTNYKEIQTAADYLNQKFFNDDEYLNFMLGLRKSENYRLQSVISDAIARIKTKRSACAIRAIQQALPTH